MWTAVGSSRHPGTDVRQSTCAARSAAAVLSFLLRAWTAAKPRLRISLRGLFPPREEALFSAGEGGPRLCIN